MKNKDTKQATEKAQQASYDNNGLLIPDKEVDINLYHNGFMTNGAKYGTRSTARPNVAPRVNLSGKSRETN
jgi:hypothetical protein